VYLDRFEVAGGLNNISFVQSITHAGTMLASATKHPQINNKCGMQIVAPHFSQQLR